METFKVAPFECKVRFFAMSPYLVLHVIKVLEARKCTLCKLHMTREKKELYLSSSPIYKGFLAIGIKHAVTCFLFGKEGVIFMGAKPKVTESWCLKCAQPLPINQFNKSYNPRHTTGVLPYCKDCCVKMARQYMDEVKTIEGTLYYMCQVVDLPYLKRVVDHTVGQINEDNKRVSNYIGRYIRSLGALHNKAQLRENVNYFSESDVDLRDMKSLRVSEVNKENAKRKMEELWGPDRAPFEIEYLESAFADYTKDVELDRFHEQLYRNLCLNDLEASQAKDAAERQKAVKQAIEIANQLGLNEIEEDKNEIELLLEHHNYQEEHFHPTEVYDKNMFADYFDSETYFDEHITRPNINALSNSKDYKITFDQINTYLDGKSSNG